MTTLRQRLLPYALLAPGVIWLIVFFVIPMYFMGELSLRTGSLAEGYQLTWAFENYTDAISEYSDPVRPRLLLRRHGDGLSVW